jgi:threonine/homoserine/homoserine lactone efflux protein
VRTQRALAVLLTVMFFALVVFGLGALFAQFHERTWGYVIGGLACLVMVYAGISSLRGSGDAGSDRPGRTGRR